MNIKESAELKQLQSRKSRLEVEIKQLDIQSKELQSRLDKTRHQFRELSKRIHTLQNSNPTITEHAILRYIERAMGFNIEQIKNEILTDDLAEKIKLLGSGHYPVPGECLAVVKNMTIVSIVKPGEKTNGNSNE